MRRREPGGAPFRFVSLGGARRSEQFHVRNRVQIVPIERDLIKQDAREGVAASRSERTRVDLNDGPVRERHGFFVRQAFAGPLQGRGVIVRPTAIYGPGNTRILKLARAMQRGYFFFPGACNNLYHPTYIDDLLAGFELTLKSETAAGQIYNLAGFRYLPLREYIAIFARLLDVAEPRLQLPLGPLKLAARVCGRTGQTLGFQPRLFPRRLGFFYFDRAFSTKKARRELGYEPRVDVEEGLSRTIDWWRREGLL